MYKLDFSDEGKNSLAKLDTKTAQRVLNKLKWLVQNIEDISRIPLEGNLSEFYKLRVGDWRVLYNVNNYDRIVTVHKVGHRREIYRGISL